MENLIIDGNKIKEMGFSGKTVYIIEGNKIKKAPEKPKSFVSEIIGAVLSAGNTNKAKPSDVKETENKSYSSTTSNEKKETVSSAPKKHVKTKEEIERERRLLIEHEKEKEIESQKKKYLIGAFVLGFFIIFFIGMLAFEYSNIWYFKEIYNIHPTEGLMSEISSARIRVVFLWIIIAIQVVGEIKLIRARSNLR